MFSKKFSTFWQNLEDIAKELNDGWEPDYSDVQKRWCIHYNKNINEFCFGCSYPFLCQEYDNYIFFRNKNVFEKFMAKFDFKEAEIFLLECNTEIYYSSVYGEF